ncbi:flagellar hook-associated protein FlgL [Metabacillus fastidiosus]|uniref:flagellar hook-associated protein FlgL n=1 Tax=Metabacillus fastidiosus TaxID=1458 RepID=UPI003D299ACB
MRVTQSMISNNMLRNLSNSYNRLSKYNDQMTTQKKINRPSDDPVVAMKGMEYRSHLSEIEQHTRNLTDVFTWLENSEDVLDKLGESIKRVNELVIQANDGPKTNDDRQKIATELEEIKKHIVTLGNTKIGDRYLFSGSNTLEKPLGFNASGKIEKHVDINSDTIEIEVSQGVKLPVNTDIESFYKAAQTIESILTDITNATTAGTDPDLSSYITNVQNDLELATSKRSVIGAQYNRAELIENRLSSNKIIANKMISDNEDIDLEEHIIKFQTAQTVHRAALSVGASVIQPTLLDFLR